MRTYSFVLAAIFLIGCASSATATQAQMEIRSAEEYSAEQFAQSKPAIGDVAPDMELRTLEGQPVRLSSFRGKNLVVIKAGYT